MLSLCALVLVRRPTPQKVPGSESWLAAGLPCWPAPGFDELRFREQNGSVREPADDPRRYPPHAAQSHLLDSLALTSHRAAVDRLPLVLLRDHQRTAPAPCARTLRSEYDHQGRGAVCGNSPHDRRAYLAPLLLSADSRLLSRRGYTLRHRTESVVSPSCVYE